MPRELTEQERIERSILKRFRRELWTPFTVALKRYELIAAGDRIAVCISGGKDSMLLAKLLQELQRHSLVPFELVFLAMDPGYRPENLALIEDNARRLGIPLTFFQTDIFSVAAGEEHNPCYLCARMRRGHLYAQAQALGCNKIALGHHFSDVIETTLMSMLWGGQLQAMPPKLRSRNFPGMELIRPMYCIREESILRWARYNDLHFLQCACRLTERAREDVHASKRQETKELIAALKKTNPNIENSIFRSIHGVWIDTMPGWKDTAGTHSFLEKYGRSGEGETPWTD